MSPWQRWRKVSINNRLMIYMTAILAIATTLYTLMYRSQAKFMEQNARQTTEQTDRLVAASERLAETTKSTLEEAKRVNKETADRADRNTKAIETQANASMSQAKTSQTTARIAKESVEASREATLTANRAQISIGSSLLDVDSDPKHFILFIVWNNDGNSFATLTGTIRIKYGPTVSNGCDYGETNIQNLRVAPRSPRTQRFTFFKDDFKVADMELASLNHQYVMFCGKVSYETLGKTFELPLCSYYDVGLKQFMDCEGAKERPD